MIGIGSSTRFSILKSRNESNSANQAFDTTNIYLKTLMIFAPAFMLNHFLVSVFSSEQDFILTQYAIPRLKLYFTTCPFIGFNIEQGKPGQNTFD